MTAAVRTNTRVDRAVYRRDGDASVNLVYHSQHGSDDHDEGKRTEHNLIVRSDKSEAEVINCAQRIVLLKLTTDRPEASRGLSAQQQV